MPNRLETLWARAAERPDTVAFSAGAVADGVPARTLTYAGLADRARSLAAHLDAAEVAPGDRVIVMLPNGLDYVTAVYGAMAAGAIAVPLFPPDASKHRDRVDSVLLETRPAAVVVPRSSADATWARLLELRLDARVIIVEELDDDDRAAQFLDRSDDGAAPPVHELAFLQYTSGSTSAPKGVMVGHDNVAANSAAIGEVFGHDDTASGVCWLPLYHDMGMVGSVFHTVEIGARCHLMDPSDLLRRPANWLRAISELGVDTAGGPNFGFDWCVEQIRDDQLDGVDLSGWRVAYNGSEPISAATIDRFADRFAAWGFDRSSFLPCYGLAEFTLLVTGGSLADPSMVRTVDGRPLVASGAPVAGTELRVVDDHERCVDDGEFGQILVAGPDRAAGYWNNTAATAATFGTGPDDPHPGFLRTGDIGVVLDGQLFVTGRAKEIIVVRGRNLHPHEIEEAAGQAVADAVAAGRDAGGRGGRTKGLANAAVATGGDREELAVVCEVPKQADLAAIGREVRRRVAETSGVQPRQVVLVSRRTVPKTSSGKIRRLEVAAALGRGEIDALHVDELPAASIGATRPRPDLDTPYRAPSGATELEVAAVWSSVLRLADVGADDDFLALGGDSLGAAVIAEELGRRFDLDIDVSDLFVTATVAEVAHLLDTTATEDDDLVEIEL
ncbi:MAG: AMP-binding protein [Acidimicrobiales bacterium]